MDRYINLLQYMHSVSMELIEYTKEIPDDTGDLSKMIEYVDNLCDEIRETSLIIGEVDVAKLIELNDHIRNRHTIN